MKELLWTIPALPFAGALILVLTGGRMPRVANALVGVGSVGLSAIMTLLVGWGFLTSSANFYRQVCWTWMDVGNLDLFFAFYLDALALVFIFVITFVGFLIHLYSVSFMADDDGFARFFAFLNLFVCAMLILVLADNLVLLYLGWEGVGLCSYLLIGFWYKEKKNTDAARKAFVVTRVGDTAMAIGLFMLFHVFGTLNIAEISRLAPDLWAPENTTAVIIALLLLGGAVGKSAQLPLQTWLPDAMAGPSPVSALIHAATMVTAGVYLIARSHVIFTLAPFAQLCVAIIGTVTLLLAGFAAITQSDLKRVLAYSTMSQIGYMFLALGVGAWSAAVFHFVIHAFFKALLFLGAGAIIVMLHHEHDMFKMGGLRKKSPLIYVTFLIGAIALAALPFITAGFYSKDQILWLAWASEKGNGIFFVAALIGAFVTAVYTFRMVFLTFYGGAKTTIGHTPGMLMLIPLVVLSFLSVVSGFIELPHNWAHVQLFSNFTGTALPSTPIRAEASPSEWMMQMLAGVISLSGVYVAYYFYIKRPQLADRLKHTLKAWNHILYMGWGFDALYDTMLVRPFVFIANISRNDVVDKVYQVPVAFMNTFHRLFVRTQTGFLRWYMMGVAIGALLILTLSLML